jgi:hypothetical protein
MDEQPAGEAGVGNSPCRQCRREMPAGAKLCSHCSSYQDWRGYLPISSTVLALLVALIGVASATLPAAVAALHHPNSAVKIASPVINGEEVYLVVSNTGDRPAAISGALLASPISDGMTLVPINPASVFIPPGSRQVGFHVHFRASARLASDMANDKRMKSDNANSVVSLIVTDFDGGAEAQRIPLDPWDTRRLIVNHRNRCEVEPSKSMDSECRDPGAGQDY